MDKASFGVRLRAARRDRKLSSDQLAELCNVSSVFIRQMECGNKLPSISTLIDLSNALGVLTDYLLQDSVSIPARDAQADGLLGRLSRISPEHRSIILSMIDAGIRQAEGDFEE